MTLTPFAGFDPLSSKCWFLGFLTHAVYIKTKDLQTHCREFHIKKNAQATNRTCFDARVIFNQALIDNV